MPPRTALIASMALACAAPAAAQQDDAAALELADKAATEKEAAKQHRVYVEGAGLRGWLRGGPTTDVARASLDLRYDTTFAPGWRAVLSDRLDLIHSDDAPRERNVNALREAYVSWQARPDVILDLGRVNIRHGAAWGYNPTDFFRDGALRSIVSPDPARLRENRLGTVVVQGQKLWERSSLSAAYSPKLEDRPSDATTSLDLGSTNAHHRWLIAGSHRFGERLNPQFLLHGGKGKTTQAGLNVSTLIGDATVAFAELAAGKGPTLIAEALGRIDTERWRRRAAFGLTYTTAFNLSLTAEADFNSAAPDRAQWDALRTASLADSLRYLQAAQDLQDLPVRRAAFLYATWRDALLRRLDVSGFVRWDAVTHSRSQWLEARYHWDRVDLALQWQKYSGDADSVFGIVPQHRAVEVSVRVYF
ncbi:hypothetical protein [Piscinibacter sp. XHJ-5]|uniref:hypothetical protein n=1 Tax=Piscinibacter sp. XHJ-5 TaxID=3037797 RepID=UPI0024533A60|nr:hypothetical protein [Piscinibacter sp. XHJ-5]